MLNDKRFMENEKTRILKDIYDMYEDEYDDTYDEINEVTGRVEFILPLRKVARQWNL